MQKHEIKSYGDIATYIIEQLRFCEVHELPQQLWDSLYADYYASFVMTPPIPLKLSSTNLNFRITIFAEYLEFVWQLNNERIFTQRFTKPNV